MRDVALCLYYYLGISLLKRQGNKARAIFVDSEPKVVQSILEDKTLKPYINSENCFWTESGRGNNWAHGYFCEDGDLANKVMEAMRREAEMCDFYQGSFMMHSIAGGTGSGLGSKLTERF